VRLLALCLLLLAPLGGKQWSKAHSVGIWIPSSWKIVKRDQGSEAFLVHGPRLGAGVPRLVLTRVADARTRTLGQVAADLERRVAKLPGWTRTVTVRKRIGAFPAVRVGWRFKEDDLRGRARFTVVLLGNVYFVLELSAAAAHFPGATFDRIEASLEVPWTKRTLAGGLTLETPAGWPFEPDRKGGTIRGPRMGLMPAMVGLAREQGAPAAPPGSKPGPKVSFLGTKRVSHDVERKMHGHPMRLRQVQAGDWSAAIILPVDSWDDLYPIAEKILTTAKLPEPAPRTD